MVNFRLIDRATPDENWHFYIKSAISSFFNSGQKGTFIFTTISTYSLLTFGGDRVFWYNPRGLQLAVVLPLPLEYWS